MRPDDARDLFPVTRDQIYLQHAGFGPLSVRGVQAVKRVARRMAESTDWEQEYARELDELRSAIAGLIKVDPEGIAFTRGTAHGLSLLSAGFDWREGDNIVSVRREFPSNVFPWSSLARRRVELRLVDAVDGRVDPDALAAIIDGRTRVLTVSWVQFWNGFRNDIQRIGSICGRKGVRFVIDAIQGLGALRLDVAATGADLVACGAQKWLMGPQGIGFCYVGRNLLNEITPPLIGGRSVALNPHFPCEDQLAFHPGARRFEESTIGWLNVAVFAAGIGLLIEVGPEVVEERVLGLARYLGEGLSHLGFSVIEPWPRSPAESSGIVSFRPAERAADVVRILGEERITAGAYDDFVRFSPHFYNTFEEMEHVLAIVGAKVGR